MYILGGRKEEEKNKIKKGNYNASLMIPGAAH